MLCYALLRHCSAFMLTCLSVDAAMSAAGDTGIAAHLVDADPPCRSLLHLSI